MNLRSHLRYAVTGRATLTIGDPARQIPARLIDVSMSGISFRCEAALPQGARAQLSLSVLAEHDFIGAAPWIVVRYCILEGRMYRVGAQFFDNDAATTQALAAIVEARARIVKGT
jgi:hypothetical protein